MSDARLRNLEKAYKLTFDSIDRLAYAAELKRRLEFDKIDELYDPLILKGASASVLDEYFSLVGLADNHRSMVSNLPSLDVQVWICCAPVAPFKEVLINTWELSFYGIEFSQETALPVVARLKDYFESVHLKVKPSQTVGDWAYYRVFDESVRFQFGICLSNHEMDPYTYPIIRVR